MSHITPILKTMLRRKLSVFLIVVQVAIATAIFSNLAFLIRHMEADSARPTGFDEELLFTATLRPINTSNYVDILYDLQSIKQLSATAQAAVVRPNPLGSSPSSGRAILRATSDIDAVSTTIYKARVSNQALPTLGLNIISGRDFTPEDMIIEKDSNGDGPKNIIISLALAKSLFGENAGYLGKLVYEGSIAREIIGITQDSLGFSRPTDRPAELTAFYPQLNESETELRYLIRATSSDQRAKLIEEVSMVLRKNHQNELFMYVEKIDDIKALRDRDSRVFVYQLTVSMLVLGLIVAFAIGGQTLFNVNLRTKQIGIRRALGASRKDIIAEILYENILICSVGLSIGVVFALVANQLVTQNLYNVPIISPPYIIVTCLVLLVVCLISAAEPAWQAGKISPSTATRTV